MGLFDAIMQRLQKSTSSLTGHRHDAASFGVDESLPHGPEPGDVLGVHHVPSSQTLDVVIMIHHSERGVRRRLIADFATDP